MNQSERRPAEEAAPDNGTAEVDAQGINHAAPVDLAQAMAVKQHAKRLRKQHQQPARQADGEQAVQDEDLEEETL